jgi:hypothetical protein
MAYTPREIEICHSTTGDGQVFTATNIYPVTASTGRSRGIVPGRLVVLNASAAGVDGIAAADTTTAGRLIVGLVKRVLTTTGTVKDRQELSTSEAGLVEVYPARGNRFRLTEDGTGGTIAAAITADSGTGVYGSVGLAVGTVTNGGTSTETNFTRPYSNDLLDSSTWSATSTTNCCILDGIWEDPRNAGASNKQYTFTIGSTYLASGVQ